MPLKVAQKPSRPLVRAATLMAKAATTEAMAAEAMPTIQARYQAGPVEKRAVTWGVRAASADASEAQICAAFALLRTARSLCVVPLEHVPDAFSARAEANGCSASVYVARWRCPKPKNL